MNRQETGFRTSWHDLCWYVCDVNEFGEGKRRPSVNQGRGIQVAGSEGTTAAYVRGSLVF